MFRIRFVLVLLTAFTTIAFGQQSPPPEGAPESGPGQAGHGQGRGGPEGRRGQFAGQGTAGNITAIAGDTLTIKTLSGTETVKVTGDTMFRRDREASKLADFKVGDTVFVMGDKSGDTWTARMVASRTGGPTMNPDDLGKKFIIGEVTKIDGTKITIKRPDKQEQTIEVDDDTSFRNSRRESVTLADVKVGDRVAGRGSVKDGTFVPSVLTVGLPDRMMMVGGPNDEQAAPPASNPPKQEKKQ
jgi:Domain of unknown function (DUF5666)